MPLTARDLPPDIRRQLLDQLRSQLGPIRYNQLVQARGEDGVVNAVLQAMEAHSPANPPPRPSILGSPTPSDSAASRWAPMIRTAVAWVLGIGAYAFLGILGFSAGEWAKWPWHSKMLLGSLVLVVDLVCIGYLVSQQQTNPTPPSPKPSAPPGDLTGCLDLLTGLWNLLQLVVGHFPVVIGAVAGPVLIVWGIVDLCR